MPHVKLLTSKIPMPVKIWIDATNIAMTADIEKIKKSLLASVKLSKILAKAVMMFSFLCRHSLPHQLISDWVPVLLTDSQQLFPLCK